MNDHSGMTRRSLVLGGAGGAGRPRHDVDVVVVGSGYAGPLIANILAAQGKRVVVLEAGPRREMKDLVSSQTWARELHGPSYVATAGANPLGVGYNVGWGLGGSGTHHYGLWPRMHEVDFKMRTRFGRGLDWPIGYDELRPYYDRIQEMFGLSGDAEQEVWRPPGAPYPLPAHELHTQAQILSRGFAELGLAVAPAPLAILSRPYRGRPACRYVAWCSSGCAIGALGHPLATVIPDARRHGVEFRTDSRVLRVLTKRGRAVGVEYADRRGHEHILHGKVVVLAAWAVEIPRILLNSEDSGLANSSGLVGRYMYPHVLVGVNGLFKETTNPHRGHTSGQVLNQDHFDPGPSKGYFGGYQWVAASAPKPNDISGFANTRSDINGPDLEPFLQNAAKHLGQLSGMGFSTPQKENGLELTDEVDEFGMRKAVVNHSYDADARALYEAARQEGLEILQAAGAHETWAGAIGAAHVMGGAIMGDDPASSVTNSFGQTHDVPNLFIAGSSLFPTGGFVNPTFTLNALALRTGEYMVDRWSDIVA